MNENKKLAIEILDVIEDYLSEKNVEIENPQREEDYPQGGGSILYGEDYYKLEDEIFYLLEKEEKGEK